SDLNYAAQLQAMPPASVNREIALELASTNYLLTQLLRVGIMHASTSADHMAALTGEPVELSQLEDGEPPEDRRDVTQDRQIGPADVALATFENADPAVATRRNGTPKHAPASTSDSAETPVSPPAPSEPVASAEPPPAPHVTPPDPTPPPGAKAQQGQTSPVAPSSPKAQDHPNEGSRSPQGAALLNGAAMVAAALTGGLRRAEPPAPAAPAAVSNAAASNDARVPAPSLLDRLAVKSKLDNLRRPETKAPAPQSPPTPGAAASAAASVAAEVTAPKAAFPTGGLRDKLGVFTADRMQARRDAEQIKGASQAGTAVLASLEALERQETTGILLKIRDAANANGGIERVLSEMRPGGAFEDLRKEFNVAISRDEGFAAAYEKATGALSSYAETRAGMISAPRPRADINFARLETLDQEIGAAAKALPSLEDGKNALDEALEGGKEAVEKAFSAIRQAFSRDSDVRGPSPSPSFGT